MKLFYYPGACSLAPHIVAQELGLSLQLEKVDLAAKKTSDGKDYLVINPKGAVPALQLENGEVITEGPAIMQLLADKNPGSGLAPAAGSLDRYRLQEMLGYINSEIHKGYSPLFNPALSDTARWEVIANLHSRYQPIEKRLEAHDYLVGNQFTAADAYFFTVTNWADHLKVDLSKYVRVAAFQQRVGSRPAVYAALKAEGLIH